MLVGLAAPALWVLLADDGRTGVRFVARLALCLVAVLQPLGAYPSPGTQMAIGSVVVALGAILALDDGPPRSRAGCRARVSRCRRWSGSSPRRSSRATWRSTVVVPR